MIVIGGYHSSNTRKLAELSEQYVTTLHIETEMDLTPELLENKRIIGIVAGASTPHWLIDKVKKAIDSF